MEESYYCPLCGRKAERYPTINGRSGVSCRICGDYILSRRAARVLRSLSESDRLLLSHCVRGIGDNLRRTPVLDNLAIFKLMAAGRGE